MMDSSDGTTSRKRGRSTGTAVSTSIASPPRDSVVPTVTRTSHPCNPNPNSVRFVPSFSHDDSPSSALWHHHHHRNEMLNHLLQVTAAHERNYALADHYPYKEALAILHELVRIVVVEGVCWNTTETGVSLSSSSCDKSFQLSFVGVLNTPPPWGVQLHAQQCWLKPPTLEASAWAHHWREQSQHMRSCGHYDRHRIGSRRELMEVVLMIFRNLSYVAANARLLAYSPDVLHILIGCLYYDYDDDNDYDYYGDITHHYPGSNTSSSSNLNHHGGGEETHSNTTSVHVSATTTSTTTRLSYSALQTLVHLVPYLDVSGQRLCCDRLFYKPPNIISPPNHHHNSNHNNNDGVSLSDNHNHEGGGGGGGDGGNGGGPKVPDPHLFGQVVNGSWGWGGMWLAKRLDSKEDALNDVHKDVVLSLAADSLIAVWSVFPALTHIFTTSSRTSRIHHHRSTGTGGAPIPRAVVLLALDVLQEFINQARAAGIVGDVPHEEEEEEEEGATGSPDITTTTTTMIIPSLRHILVRMPDALLDQLLQLLFVPRLGSSSSSSSTTPLSSKQQRLTMMGYYDHTVDAEVRDRVLEILVPLLELDSPRMAVRMGHCPTFFADTTTTTTTTAGRCHTGSVLRVRLWDAILPILSTTVGRHDAPVLAAQLLKELALAPENRNGFLYVHDRLVDWVSRSSSSNSNSSSQEATTTSTSRVASLLLNSFLYDMNVDHHHHGHGSDSSTTTSSDSVSDSGSSPLETHSSAAE